MTKQMTAPYIRLQRSSTDSGMTYKLPEPITVDAELSELAAAVTEYAARDLPGWQVLAFSPSNPQEDLDNE